MPLQFDFIMRNKQAINSRRMMSSVSRVSDRVDFDSLLRGYNERLVTAYSSNVRDIFVTRVMYVEISKISDSNSRLPTTRL